MSRTVPEYSVLFSLPEIIFVVVNYNNTAIQVGSLEPHADRMIREMQQLDLDADADEPRCDCGLPLEKSGLPRGWSIHISQDEESFGEVIFTARCYVMHSAGYAVARCLIRLFICLSVKCQYRVQTAVTSNVFAFGQPATPF